MKSIVLVLVVVSASSCIASICLVQAANFRHPAEALVVANRITKDATNSHRAELLLQYFFAGRIFREWQPEGKSGLKRSQAEILLGEHSPGSHLQIFPDPSNPLRLMGAISGWEAHIGAILFGILAFAAAIAAQVVYLN